MAITDPEIEIDAPEGEYVTCEIHTSQLDHLFQLLSPQAKAVAILNGLNEDIT